MAKFRGASPKTDDGTWAETLQSLKLKPHPLRNAETFEVIFSLNSSGFFNRYIPFHIYIDR